MSISNRIDNKPDIFIYWVLSSDKKNCYTYINLDDSYKHNRRKLYTKEKYSVNTKFYIITNQS